MQITLAIYMFVQYWRLLVHHLACASSSDLLLVELILYNAAINVERGFGSVKYAVGCVSMNTWINTEFIDLVISIDRAGLEHYRHNARIAHNATNTYPWSPHKSCSSWTSCYRFCHSIPIL
jgi:hypothetical protein